MTTRNNRNVGNLLRIEDEDEDKFSVHIVQTKILNFFVEVLAGLQTSPLKIYFIKLD